jgi:hypothetical protein
MQREIDLAGIYVKSEDVVSREIEGKFILIPVISGMGESPDDIFTMNETGRAIWDKIDGKKSLKDLTKSLCSEFEGSAQEIEKDVFGIAAELLKRKMLKETGKK